MWADPHNRSIYVPPSFTIKTSKDSRVKRTDAMGENNEPKPKKKKGKEPALSFLFNNWPKDFAKGYVLGTCGELCDALIGDPGDDVSQKMLAFTFNKHHELVMNVTSDDPYGSNLTARKEQRGSVFSGSYLAIRKKSRFKWRMYLNLTFSCPYTASMKILSTRIASHSSARLCG